MAKSYNSGTKQTAGMNRANSDTQKGAPKHFTTRDAQRANVHNSNTHKPVQERY